jgi:hypothetical protein
MTRQVPHEQAARARTLAAKRHGAWVGTRCSVTRSIVRSAPCTLRRRASPAKQRSMLSRTFRIDGRAALRLLDAAQSPLGESGRHTLQRGGARRVGPLRAVGRRRSAAQGNVACCKTPASAKVSVCARRRQHRSCGQARPSRVRPCCLSLRSVTCSAAPACAASGPDGPVQVIFTGAARSKHSRRRKCPIQDQVGTPRCADLPRSAINRHVNSASAQAGETVHCSARPGATGRDRAQHSVVGFLHKLFGAIAPHVCLAAAVHRPKAP